MSYPTLLPLPRASINDAAWNDCVAASPDRILYAYTWYLDAVTTCPNYRWEGLVLIDEAGRYMAVMPIPLRQKQIVWRLSVWVVHQPLFCQFLGVFSRYTVESAPFVAVIQELYRYGSSWQTLHRPNTDVLLTRWRSLTTHVLDLSVDYATIRQRYSPDRQRNLRRAKAVGWQVDSSIDCEPLLQLFQQYHAGNIDGGVSDEAYQIFRRLVNELQQRGLASLRYAKLATSIEAGALFVQEGNRIIYLFNAASEVGRRGNARTLLIDQIIQEKAGQALWFDFESPEKPSIVQFYESFGALPQPFWEVKWNKLPHWQQAVRTVIRLIK